MFVVLQSSEIYAIEIPSTKDDTGYCPKAFHNLRAGLTAARYARVRTAHGQNLPDSPPGDLIEVHKDNRLAPLVETLEQSGKLQYVSHEKDPAVTLRHFMVVDGNHRLAALMELKRDLVGYVTPLVRVAILDCDTAQTLLETGSLLNIVRGVQATDTFYDRVVWVRQFAM